MEVMDGRLCSRVVCAGSRLSWRREEIRKGELATNEREVKKKGSGVESRDQWSWEEGGGAMRRSIYTGGSE